MIWKSKTEYWTWTRTGGGDESGGTRTGGGYMLQVGSDWRDGGGYVVAYMDSDWWWYMDSDRWWYMDSEK